MGEVSEKNFGVLIALLIPGFLCLWVASYWNDSLGAWLAKGPASSPSIGGFFFTTLASLSVGMVLSAVRWIIIDHIMWATGIKECDLDYSKLSDKDKYAAFEGCIVNHYRYYQYYSNTLVALIIVIVLGLFNGVPGSPCIIYPAAIALGVCLFLGARDVAEEILRSRIEDLVLVSQQQTGVCNGERLGQKEGAQNDGKEKGHEEEGRKEESRKEESRKEEVRFPTRASDSRSSLCRLARSARTASGPLAAHRNVS